MPFLPDVNEMFGDVLARYDGQSYGIRCDCCETSLMFDQPVMDIVQALFQHGWRISQPLEVKFPDDLEINCRKCWLFDANITPDEKDGCGPDREICYTYADRSDPLYIVPCPNHHETLREEHNERVKDDPNYHHFTA